MIWPAVAVRRVPVPRQEDFGSQHLGPCDRRIDVLDLEPQQYAVARRPVIGVADPPVMVLHLPPVQLQHKLPRGDQALVVRPAVVAPAVEQPLIPPAACFDVIYANQWLWAHQVLRVLDVLDTARPVRVIPAEAAARGSRSYSRGRPTSGWGSRN